MQLRSSLLLAAAAAACLTSGGAFASLVYDSSILAPAQGFGTAPRILSFQGEGTESGCVGVSGSGGITVGPSACLPAASAVHDSNGVTNLGGSEVSPLSDNQKYGIPTLGSLGITTASQIGVLFNATEPSGDGLTITDVTLKFFSSTGSLLGAIDGQQNFVTSNPGNGVAGFTFVVSSDEQAYVNTLIGPNVILALESTITDASGGPETYLIYNLSPGTNGGGGGSTGIPEPASMLLLGASMVGLGFARRRSAQ